MAKATPPYTSFNGGEVSPELEGRIDIEKYHSSLYRCENMIPMIQGPARRRSGTRFEKEAKDSTKPPFLSKFIFNVTQSFILEWGDKYVRFHTNHGAVLEALQTITAATQASPAVITVTGHGYSTGDEVFISAIVGMTRLNNRYFKITVIDANTFSLQDFGGNPVNSTTYAAYVSGGTVGRVYEIATPYAYADLTDQKGLFALRFAQIEDVVYVTNTLSVYSAQKLSRLADNNWTIAPVVFGGGPFKPLNANNSPVMYASGQTGQVTVTVNIAAVIASIGTDGGGPFITLTKPLDAVPPPGTSVGDLTSDKNTTPTHTVAAGSTVSKLYLGSTAHFMQGDLIVIGMGPSTPVFLGGYVGALLYLGTHDIHRVKPWIVGQACKVGQLRRYNGVTYKCFDAGVAGVNCAVVPPTQLFGDAYDGSEMSGNGWTYQDPGYGWGTIIAVAADGNSCTVQVGDPTDVDPPVQYPIGVTADSAWQNDGASGGISPTPLWAIGAWNSVDGYPTHVYFFLNRLVFARFQDMRFSVSEDFENFVAETPGGVVTDDMAISITAPVQDVITWLQEATSVEALGVGTSGGELVAGQISDSAPLSPTNTRISPQGTRGSSAIPALRIANGILFVQTSGKKVRKLVYEFYTNSWQSTDLTILAREIAAAGLTAMDYQQEPDSVVWAIRKPINGAAA
ncbi:MAG: ubiquitin-activating E1 FCCH domain-containing protein [Candidatus Acidiferrales bacterium]